jgi:hypothetical protein
MSSYIGYRNWFDGQSGRYPLSPWTFAYSLGLPDDLAPMVGYPAENLQERQLSSVARFERVGGGAVTGPCGVELVNPFASGITAINIIVVIGRDLPDYIGYYIGGYSLVAVSAGGAYSMADNQSIGFYLLPAGLTPGNIKLQWNDIPPGDYYELSRVYITNALELSDGVESNWNLGFDDSGTLEDSEGKQWYENKGVRTRKLSFNVSAMPATVAFSPESGSLFSNTSILDMAFHAGQTGDVIAIPRSQNGEWIFRAAVYGHFQNTPTISHQAGDNYATSFTVIEER